MSETQKFYVAYHLKNEEGWGFGYCFASEEPSTVERVKETERKIVEQGGFEAIVMINYWKVSA